MPPEIECPDSARLSAYAQGDLSTKDIASIEQHLAECESCLNRYLELTKPQAVVNIPDCHVIKEIGRGRFGVVYKAWWIKDKPRIIALKVSNWVGDQGENRFEREIAVLTKLESPGIVKCLGSGEVDATRYYMMDLVEGVHLDEYLALSCSGLIERLTVLRRVCLAVANAHELGVVHRDLKPSNILVTPDGQPHILDFGICALEQGDWSSWNRQTITQYGDIIGTLRYMSPEQAWGGVAGPIQEQSDIWSLGMILFEIVTGGGYPYSCRSTRDKPAHEALLERIRKELPRLPKLEGFPRGRELEILLERCLAWEPCRRVESAQKLADDLQRYCEGKPVKTKPLGLFHRLNRFAIGEATRTRWVLSVAFVTIVTAVLWVSVLLIDVGWFTAGYAFDGPDHASSSPLVARQPRENFLVVGVFDDTVEGVSRFAAENHIEGVTSDVTTWRAVHGHIMQRLVPAHPKVVVWDYVFRRPTRQDADLLVGIDRLEQSGVPVVLASFGYRGDGTPDLSPNLVDTLGGRLRHGAVSARDMISRPGEFVLANKSEDQTIVPSLALTTLAAVLHPRASLDWEAIQPDDLVACCTFRLVRPEQWERQTVPYEQLLLCSDDQLRTLAEDRVVIMGDMRTARFGFFPDRHRVMYDSTIIDDVPGCYLLGDAIAGSLSRRHLHLELVLPVTALLFALGLATVGCLLPIRLATCKRLEHASYRRVLWLVLWGMSAASLVIMITTRSRVAVCLGFVGFSLLPPLACSFWVEFARNRHRFLERSRRAIDECGVVSRETATLKPRRRRSRSEP